MLYVQQQIHLQGLKTWQGSFADVVCDIAACGELFLGWCLFASRYTYQRSCFS